MFKRLILGILLTVCLVFGLIGVVSAQELTYPALNSTVWEATTRLKFNDHSYGNSGREAWVVYLTLEFTDQVNGRIAGFNTTGTDAWDAPGATLSMWYYGSNISEAADVAITMFGLIGYENEELRSPRPYLTLFTWFEDGLNLDAAFNCTALVASLRYTREGRFRDIRVSRLMVALDTPEPRWGARGLTFREVPGT